MWDPFGNTIFAQLFGGPGPTNNTDPNNIDIFWSSKFCLSIVRFGLPSVFSKRQLATTEPVMAQANAQGV